MKTHTIKTPKAELMIVELPKEQSVAFGYYSDQLTIFDPEKDFRDSEIKFEGHWELLGNPDEIREEDAMALVESFGRGKLKRFKGYNKNQFEKTAKESLLSLLDEEIYWENPIPTPEIQGGHDEFGNFHGGLDDNWISAFEEAEQKTFDRNRTLIFKKNQSPTNKI